MQCLLHDSMSFCCVYFPFMVLHMNELQCWVPDSGLHSHQASTLLVYVLILSVTTLFITQKQAR
jgi:hypothetical protein